MNLYAVQCQFADSLTIIITMCENTTKTYCIIKLKDHAAYAMEQCWTWRVSLVPRLLSFASCLGTRLMVSLELSQLMSIEMMAVTLRTES